MTETKAVVTEAPALISVGTQSLVDNASRLGLTWELKLGTVVAVTSTGAATVTLDADTVPIGVVSMVGTLTVNSRVYVMSVPPSGNFVIGQASAQETGVELFTFAGVTTATVAVSFTVPFIQAPRVFTNINNGAAATANWHSRAINITTTGFTLFVFSTVASTWTDVEVQWLAVSP
jgi:hypothetical protein